MDRLRRFENAWQAAEEEIWGYLEAVDEGDVTPSLSVQEITEELGRRFDFKEPMRSSDAVREVAKLLRLGQTHTPHRNYYGLFNPDVMPETIAADALAAAFNPQLATVHHSPAAIAMEAHVLQVFQELLGHDPASSQANFTTAGSEANHSAVLVALTKHLPGYAEHGLRGERPVFYVSAEAHHSFVKIAHAVGIGRGAVREVETDARLRMSLTHLNERVERDRASGGFPFLVVGTAGTTAAGVIDPLPELAHECRRQGLWFHVDAAWGGPGLLSAKLRDHLRGIEQADSVTMDAHKWLSVPMGAGMFFCRDGESALKTFEVRTSYMPIAGGVPDPFHSTMQWSRRFTGLKVFLALASVGVGGYREVIEHQTAMGEQLRSRLREAGWTIENETPLPLVNFSHPRILSGEVSLPDILSEINRRKQAWISDVRLSDGRHVFRACITNYRTDETDLETLVSELSYALEAASRE